MYSHIHLIVTSIPNKYNDTSNRIYEDIDYSEKDFAKSCGARWDSDRKSWYFKNEEDHDNFLFN